MSLLLSVVAIGLLTVTVRLWLRRHRPLIRTPEQKDRRRGYRVALATPVFVYGWIVDEPFSENTETLNVSAVGGLIPLSAIVIPSQELILTNLQTNEDLPCRVARSVKAEDGKILAGLEFLKRAPNFWQIDFVSVPPHADATRVAQHGARSYESSYFVAPAKFGPPPTSGRPQLLPDTFSLMIIERDPTAR
jgi:hypothetical protein